MMPHITPDGDVIALGTLSMSLTHFRKKKCRTARDCQRASDNNTSKPLRNTDIMALKGRL